jgi:molybdopterin synthase catalytic subunit
MIRVRVLFLGPAREAAGRDEIALDLSEGACVGDVRSLLVERSLVPPRLLEVARLAVNQRFADESAVLADGDEVAVIPPVSGGAPQVSDTWIDLLPGPIPLLDAHRFVGGDANLGGIVTFCGTTRLDTDPQHGPLVHLEYQVYEGMARRQLDALATEARSRWSVGRLVLLHRVGVVPPGEVSVLIAVACPHRAEAFAACRWLIDTLKKDVPIWKRDVFADGFQQWVEPGGG